MGGGLLQSRDNRGFLSSTSDTVYLFPQKYITYNLQFPSTKARKTIFSPTGCPKTYVRLSGTVRNLVWTCKPLKWLIVGQAHFSLEKNTETVENWLQITVELKFILYSHKSNLILDKLRLTFPFYFATLRLFGQELLGFGQPNVT